MKRLPLFVGLTAIICMLAYTGIASSATAAANDKSVIMTNEESRFVDLVNKERVSRGLSKLTVDPLLIQVGRGHSQEMGDKHYFSHDSPTPGIKTALDRYLLALKYKPQWALVGENLYYCTSVDVEDGHTALMNSKTHRANILEPRYEKIGVGAYINSRGEFYVTEMFLAKTD